MWDRQTSCFHDHGESCKSGDDHDGLDCVVLAGDALECSEVDVNANDYVDWKEVPNETHYLHPTAATWEDHPRAVLSLESWQEIHEVKAREKTWVMSDRSSWSLQG